MAVRQSSAHDAEPLTGHRWIQADRFVTLLRSMTRPPLIGITTSEVRRPLLANATPESEPPQPELALGMPYVRALARSGAIPVVLPPLPLELVPALLQPLAGVCL